MKLSGVSKKLKNCELVALSLAVSHYLQKFDSKRDQELYKDLRALEFNLFKMVKSNTHTHYKINIEGVEDQIITKEDKEIDNFLDQIIKRV